MFPVPSRREAVNVDPRVLVSVPHLCIVRLVLGAVDGAMYQCSVSTVGMDVSVRFCRLSV